VRADTYGAPQAGLLDQKVRCHEGTTTMIPAAFDYHAPSAISEATALLARLGEDAKVLSGGPEPSFR
jgi:hypothetical protein